MGLPGYITLIYPEALLLGAALVYLYVRRLRRKNLWRLSMLILAVALLGIPHLARSSKSFDLYLLVDRSRSISQAGQAKQKEIIDLVARQLESGDRLGIVSFNDRAYIEQVASHEVSFESFGIPYSQDATDLTDGLNLALSQIPEGRPARIMVLSDGEYTGPEPLREAQVARQRKIPIYYRHLQRLELFNLSVRDVDLPDKIIEGEPFRVVFTVHSTMTTPGRYRLYRNGRAVGTEETEGWRNYSFLAGENRIFFTDSVGRAGIHAYRLEVEPIPSERETMVSDNFAERFVKVVGERPLLVVNNDGAPDNVSRILSAGGLKHHMVAIDRFHMGINQLEGYKGVILDNVPVLGLTLRELEALRDFVQEEGGGILVTGGNRSFAMGGYYKSLLDPLLPVSLEDRQQSKKVSTAFSIVLDRSGSMSIRTPSGQTKMALANNAAVECVRLMSPVDSLSVIAVDSAAHLFVRQQSVDQPDRMISDIRSIESMGGGIFVYTGLAAAGHELIRSTQLNKHILLFADANDAEEPGDYEKLLEDYTRAGITVSVVGLGTENDSDSDFLKDVAKRGGGSIYFSEDAAQLVQFFTADTITYTRNSFIEDAAPMKIRAGAYAIAPEQRWADFTGAGYNLLFSRPKADMAIQTVDEDQAPVLDFWQRGLGRVAALALDANGPFAADKQYGDIMLSTARWIMGSQVNDNMQVKVGYEGRTARIEMEVSREERERIGQAQVEIYTPEGKTISRPMHWESHNRLALDVRLGEPGCYRGVIRVGDQTYKIGPMSIPVSPEFLYDKPPGFGNRTLTRMAALSGGREVLDVRDLFERTVQSRISESIALPLLVLLMILMLLEIAEARFGMLVWMRRTGQVQWARMQMARTRIRGSRGRRRTARRRAAPGGSTPRGAEGPATGKPYDASGPDAVTPPGEDEPTEPAPESAPERPAAPDMDYLTQSKRRAMSRLRKTDGGPDRPKSPPKK